MIERFADDPLVESVHHDVRWRVGGGYLLAKHADPDAEAALDALPGPGIYVWHTPTRAIYVGLARSVAGRIETYLGLAGVHNDDIGRLRLFTLTARYFDEPLMLSVLTLSEAGYTARPDPVIDALRDLEVRVIRALRPSMNVQHANYERDVCEHDVYAKLRPDLILTDADLFGEP